MKINQVKQFVACNVSRFEKNAKKSAFNLYDKDNVCCGEYKFIPQRTSQDAKIESSMSVTRIMHSKLRQAMQEIVCTDKNYVTLKDITSNSFTKSLPSEITTTTTILDFVNDKFMTVRSVSKLLNKLQKIAENDSGLKYSDDFVIYEPLKEKPKYEKSVEYVREGTISDVTEQNSHRSEESSKHFPYIFW